jgi:hypothetical protein
MKISKISTHKAHPKSSRFGSLPKTIIYFQPVGETLLANLENRKTRPYNEYRKLLPEVFKRLGWAPSAKVKWAQRAGCPCPCSPGFVIDGNENFYQNDVIQSIYIYVEE